VPARSILLVAAVVVGHSIRLVAVAVVVAGYSIRLAAAAAAAEAVGYSILPVDMQMAVVNTLGKLG
jgi:hypothetical protein